MPFRFAADNNVSVVVRPLDQSGQNATPRSGQNVTPTDQQRHESAVASLIPVNFNPVHARFG
jgi:hypothetical protein